MVDKKLYESLTADIFSRFPSVQKYGFTPGAYKPGLKAMEDFDRELGFPSRSFRSIHVAGTNGKGSVANMIASALTGAGYKTGLYTSPHLVDFRERARIDGEMVPREYVVDFLQRWKPYFEKENLSFFEITTGLAFKWFADSGVDAAVIEAGLGGRLDSTNIIRPVLSVVTSIGLDHCNILGNTLEAIAGEKAGIFKRGVPALVGERRGETEPVFREKAAAFCPLFYADELYPSLAALWDREGREVDLGASVQKDNVHTALGAAHLLQSDFPALADKAKLFDSLEHTARRMHFCGRWQHLQERPEVIADIGHNAHALRYNFAQLKAMGRPLTLVYGIMADKDLEAIVPLMPEGARFIFTAPSTPRALPSEELLRRFLALRPGENAVAVQSVADAVKTALDGAGENDVIYIGGSTFVVAQAIEYYGKIQF